MSRDFLLRHPSALPKSRAPLSEVLKALARNIPDAFQLTRDLVTVNSHSSNIRGVSRVARLLVEVLDLPGLSTRLVPGKPSGPHVLAMSSAAKRSPYIALVGHHDTVFPPGTFDGWRVEEAWAFGPGCFDMKASLAMMWATLKTFSEFGLLELLPVVFCSVSDEEVGSPTGRTMLQGVAQKCKAALVLESGRSSDAIVTRRRGIGFVRAIATGRAAHAGNEHNLGANAIWRLSRFVNGAQELTDYGRGLTVNVGRIEGGVGPTIVATDASAEIDFRFETVADGLGLLARLNELVRSTDVPGTRLVLEGGVTRSPLEPSEASSRLYAEYAECQRQAGMGSGEHPIVGGGSDANTLCAFGVPVIDGLGPRGRAYHTLDEGVDLSSLYPKAEALARYLYAQTLFQD
jgi:glutamate carboxypeptidase